VVSTLGSDFNFDDNASATAEQVAPFLEGELGPVPQLAAACGTDPAGYLTEGPGLSAFALRDGAVYHTYSAYARGLEILMGFYPLLDRAPLGRNEGDSPDMWIRRHDEYGEAGA
jgi:predicted dithiol-disulfide oxidoreductase (DUF899 family)